MQKYQELKEREEAFKNRLEQISEHLSVLSQKIQEKQEIRKDIETRKKDIKAKQEECATLKATLTTKFKEPKERLQIMLEEFLSKVKCKFFHTQYYLACINIFFF